MPEGETSRPHPDIQLSVSRPEARVEQKISEQVVRALVDRFSDISRQYYEGAYNESVSFKDKGIVEGKYSALENVLKKLGQKEVIQRVDSQAFHGESAEHIDLAPITQPGSNIEEGLLAEYERQHMLRLLSADSRPHIRMVDRITGRAKHLNNYFEYASGMNEGKLEEMKGFLQTIGCSAQMDSLQQEAEHLFQTAPQRMAELVKGPPRF